MFGFSKSTGQSKTLGENSWRFYNSSGRLLSAIDHADLDNVTSDQHHAAVTLGVGSDAILSLSGQELTLGDVATQAELNTHAGAADPHTGYRLESADHSHQSTGAEAGQLDHGLALTGLTDDDHTQYALLAGRAGGQNLALGTKTSPGIQLDISAALAGLVGQFIDNTNTAGYAKLALNGGGTDSDSGLSLVSFGSTYSGVGARIAGASVLQGGEAGGLSLVAKHASSTIRFYTSGTGTVNERVRINIGGDVWLSTIGPNLLVKTDGSQNLVPQDPAADFLTQYALLAGRSGTNDFTGDITLTDQLGVGTASPDVGYRAEFRSIAGTAGIGSVALRGDINRERWEILSNAGPGIQGVNFSGSVGSEGQTTGASQFLAFFGGSGFDNTPARIVASRALILLLSRETFTTTAQGTDIGFETVNTGTTTRRSTFLLGGDGTCHVRPVGTADVDLEVSNGVTQGGGTIHRAASATHSARARKAGITPISPARPTQAIADIKVLQPVSFRYLEHRRKIVDGPLGPSEIATDETFDNPASKVYEGYVFEDAPESIRGDHEDIVIDKRIMNLELSMKAVIAALERRGEL